MDHDGSMSRMLRMCEWVMRLAYTNLLWLLFTIFGAWDLWIDACDHCVIFGDEKVDTRA